MIYNPEADDRHGRYAVRCQNDRVVEAIAWSQSDLACWSRLQSKIAERDHLPVISRGKVIVHKKIMRLFTPVGIDI